MAPSGFILLTTFLTISSALAAPHNKHNKLQHHRKHPMHHKNATALGVTGTGTGGYVMPLSTGIIIDSSAPVLTVTVSPIPLSDATAAVSPATDAAAVGPGAPAAAASQTVSPEETASASSEAALAPSDTTPATSDTVSDPCDTGPETVTVTSTETDYVTVTAGPDDASADPTAAATTSVPYGMGNSTAAPAMTGSASVSFVAPDSMSSTVDATSSSSGGEFFESSSTSSSAAASSSTSSSSSSAAVPTTTAAPVAPTTTPAASSTTASPSSAPSTSPSTGTSGAKRGLSFNDPALTNAFSQSSKIAWTYNWGQSPTGTVPSSFEFVPMLWGLEDEFTGPWAAAASSAIASGSKHLLSFNEPDLASQSNISPSDAAAGHKQYMNPFSGQALIGSPAITNGGGSSGLAWLQSFFDSCDGGCKVDFITFHWYDSASNIPYFKSHINDVITLAQKNGVSKVWLTEFQGSGSAAQQSAMLDEVMPYMDSLEAMDRYAWFMCADQNLVDGTSMSPLGTTYAS